MTFIGKIGPIWRVFIACAILLGLTKAQDIIACGGFVQSEVEINFSLIEVKLYTKQGSLKYQTDCAPNNGYYMIPVYDKGEYTLRVEPPPGWTFEPESFDINVDGKNDPCSKTQDINFKFTGFGVVGKVVSKGQSSGPAGVTLTLKKPRSQDVVKTTVSGAGGGYTFEKVLPGEYVVEGSHERWLFETNTSPVVVGRETGNVGTPVTVLGYDVQGHVLGDGEPVRDVMFLLFSDTVGYDDVHGCDPFPAAGLPREIPTEPLCYTESQEDGTFVFGALPCGKYNLIPFYQGALITFDVLPASLDFEVNHDSVTLKEPFQVAGFSVGGTIRTNAGGEGIENAKIILNGKEHTTTKKFGRYTLEGMKTGTYTVDVKAKHMSFETQTIKISPNTPQLSDIYVSKFSVCGHVIIDKLPEGLTHLSKQKTVSIATKSQGKGKSESSTILTEEDGRFCTMLAPGSYIVKVDLSETETKAGLKLTPAEREVKVTDSPIREVKFTQFRAQVSGKISCLESCGPLQLTLSAVGRHDDRQTIQSQTFTDGSRFTFHNIMPGKYKVQLLKDEWCWRKSSLELEVFDRDVNNLEFVQSGYILSCSLSHDITLNFAQEQKSGNVGSFDLTKGINKFCLSQPGLYKLTPVSCHKFERDVYDYETSSPRVLSLTAVSHRLEGSVVTQERQDDILISIRTSSDLDNPAVLGPLKLDELPEEKSRQKEEKPTEKDAKSAEKNNEKDAKNKGKDKKSADKEIKPSIDEKPSSPERSGPFTYKFSHYARSGEKLTISGASKVLLFHPASVSVSISGESCPGEVAKFEGKKGVFIIGQVQPPLSGVQIMITPETGTAEPIEMTTDNKGAYRVGPLHGDQEYAISAHMDGYVLTPGGQKGHFNAFKLGQINVQVSDENKQPLGGVLLSLSGGNSYRSNNLTHSNGSMSFTSLSPGQYYLRPMMKEYSFQPNSQMIEVTEGSSQNIQIGGNRVAFSCYGAVTSLNGEPESEILVEASGLGTGDCGLLQEEAKTESDGSFRIRGLQPKCEYEIRLKSGSVNQHIERAAPKSRQVQVLNEDIKDIHIIAFRRLNQLDLSGNVVTSQEHLPSIKIHLYKESNLDSPIHSTSLSTTSFFYLPPLKIDNQDYVLRLESTLSKSSFEYSPQEITFTANSTYRHFTFRFDPKRKHFDQDLNQSSLLALLVTILVIYVGYNHKRLLPLMYKNIDSLRASLTKSHGSSVNEPSPSPSNPSRIEIQMVHRKQKPRKA